MRLVTFRRGRGEPKPGALWQEHVLDLTGLAKDLATQRGTVRRGRGGFPRTVLEIVQGGEAIMALTREAWEHGQRLVGPTAAEDLAQRRLAYPVKRVRLLAPIPSPARNVFCLGRNYADHAAERGAAAPEHPVYFTKPATAVVGPGDDVVHHAITKELDYEVELTAVIGTGGRDIARADALKHVFGYTIINDVSARDFQFHTTQWSAGKVGDTLAPVGPYIADRTEIPDPHVLDLKAWVNGQLMQDGSTRNFIFDIRYIIEYLTNIMTLSPGDLIATGTPAGVGFSRKPQVTLQPGDRMKLEITGLGTLENTVKDA